MELCSVCECSIERGVENDLAMPICDACAEAEGAEDDGQPSEYDEWQDYYGGDDWDQGQYDEF